MDGDIDDTHARRRMIIMWERVGYNRMNRDSIAYVIESDIENIYPSPFSAEVYSTPLTLVPPVLCSRYREDKSS